MGQPTSHQPNASSEPPAHHNQTSRKHSVAICKCRCPHRYGTGLIPIVLLQIVRLVPRHRPSQQLSPPGIVRHPRDLDLPGCVDSFYSLNVCLTCAAAPNPGAVPRLKNSRRLLAACPLSSSVCSVIRFAASTRRDCKHNTFVEPQCPQRCERVLGGHRIHATKDIADHSRSICTEFPKDFTKALILPRIAPPQYELVRSRNPHTPSIVVQPTHNPGNGSFKPLQVN